MGRQQKKFEKKKERERAVQVKLQRRREVKARKLKEARQEAQELETYNKLVKERIQLEQWTKVVEGKIPDDLREKIQNNIEILKALEEDHAAELKAIKEARERAAEQAVKQAETSELTPEAGLTPEE